MAATPFVFRDVKLLYNEYDLSGDHNSMTLGVSRTELENTVFGDVGVRRLAGMQSMEFSHSGFYSTATTTDVDPLLFAGVGTADTLLTVLPDGTAEGDVAYFTKAVEFEYAPLGSVNEVTPFTANALSQGEKVVRGNLMNFSTETGAGNSTGVQYGLVGATQSLYAMLHVTAYTGAGSGLDVTIYSDDNSGFSSEVLRGTFTTATDVTSQWLTPVAGAIADDDYWRAKWTADLDSVTFAVSMGIMTTVAV